MNHSNVGELESNSRFVEQNRGRSGQPTYNFIVLTSHWLSIEEISA